MAILTVARALGSGGRTVGDRVARLLNYNYVDREKILEDMRKLGEEWEDHAKHYDENYPTLYERYESSFRAYVALTQFCFLDYALNDSVVIMGRGGNFLLKGIPFALRIRIQAPIAKRIEHIEARMRLNAENSRYLLQKADKEMAGAVYLIYGRHWDDPEQYDIVFDSGSQPIEEIVETVKAELLKRDTLKTPEAENKLRLRVISAKIKAAILTSRNLTLGDIAVEPKEDGLMEYGVVLRGVAHETNDIKEVGNIAKTIAGDLPVDNQIEYRMLSRVRGGWHR